MFYLRNRRFDTSSKAQYLLTVGVGVASFPVMRMRLSPPELNYHNAGVIVVRPTRRIMGSAAESAWDEFFMRQPRREFFRYAKRLWSGNQGCYHSPSECCDSSFCFTVIRTRSSEERVLSTATLRTMLPFNPVSPACFDPLTVMM